MVAYVGTGYHPPRVTSRPLSFRITLLSYDSRGSNSINMKLIISQQISLRV